MGAEAMFGIGKEVIGGKVIVKLALYNALNYFGYDGDDGYRSEIGRIERIAGFVDRIDKRVLPLVRNITSEKVRVHYVEQHRANHRQRQLQ